MVAKTTAVRAAQAKAEEDKLADARRQGQAQFDSIRGMVEALKEVPFDASHPEDHREVARDAILEDALSVQVRSGWYNPSEFTQRNAGRPEPAEYEILLCTGGTSLSHRWDAQ